MVAGMGRLVDRFVARERRTDALLPADRFAAPPARWALRRGALGRAVAMAGAVALVVLLGWGAGGTAAFVAGLVASAAVVGGTGLWVWAAADLARIERSSTAGAPAVGDGRRPPGTASGAGSPPDGE